MSAPDTNPKKQACRHVGPLIGMAVAVLVGVLLIFFWIFEETAESDPPANPSAQQTEVAPLPQAVEPEQITRPETE
ncbi:hypothetical protein [Pararhodobacter zhoushanensis]|uniref:hypothetical protein n=1 Tax=Pararhodobacter zhoushanensis TaxID=2479545 RepID=UPI000F8C57AE|nr:hypothetical protein [Pararhodobacter zhoushanensis]